MRSVINFFCAAVFIFLLPQNCFAQTSAGNSDNALNYNRLLKEKTGDGVYKIVGVFKVTGTPYLFGEKAKSDLFAPDATGYNIFLSYNTYNQEVEFYSSANPDKPLIKEPGTVDSFVIKQNSELGITQPIKFIYGSILGTDDKFYFKEIYKGTRFSVYKQYKSELGYVSDNYIQSELRQFDLSYTYYYTDAEKKDKGIKKLKSNTVNIIKEFKDIKDLSATISPGAFEANQEEALKKVFEYLNN